MNLEQMPEFFKSVRETIGPFTDPLEKLLESVFTLFKGSEVAIALSVAILAVAAVSIFYLIYKIFPMSNKLRQLTRIVRANNTSREDFKAAYQKIDEASRKPKFLRHAWMEFTESLVIPPEHSREVIRNAVRPEFYLNVSAAEAAGKSMRFFQALPNYFVGFGLLFTFMGLVAAIYFAKAGVSGDVEAVKKSLANLLNAATFKFMTSIAGLFSSIVFSIFYRLVTQNLQRRFDQFCEALEKGMLLTTHESIAFEQKQELEKQTDQLKRFNTDFAIEVGDQIRDRMSESMADVMRPLTDAVQGLAGNVGQMNQDALAEMAKIFGDDLKGAAGSEMAAMVRALGEIKGSLSTVVNSIEETSSNFKSRMADSAERIEALLGNAGGQLGAEMTNAGNEFTGKMKEASETLEISLAPLAGQIGRFEESIDKLDAKLETQRQAFQDVAEKVNGITGHVAQTIDDLRSAATPLASVSNQFESTAKEIRAASEATASAQAQLQTLAEEISETTVSMKEAWQNHETRFADVDTSLAGAVEQLTTGADAYRAHVESFVSGLDKELNKSVQLLSGGIGALKEAVEELIELHENARRDT